MSELTQKEVDLIILGTKIGRAMMAISPRLYTQSRNDEVCLVDILAPLGQNKEDLLSIYAFKGPSRYEELYQFLGDYPDRTREIIESKTTPQIESVKVNEPIGPNKSLIPCRVYFQKALEKEIPVYEGIVLYTSTLDGRPVGDIRSLEGVDLLGILAYQEKPIKE
jgi:hypothetical protein